MQRKYLQRWNTKADFATWYRTILDKIIADRLRLNQHRVIHLLTALCVDGDYGRCGVVFTSTTEIAKYTGIRREAIYAVLRALKEKGYFTMSGGGRGSDGVLTIRLR